ncbi:MAG TPA: Ig-like domain repeat protein, partial [Casimicrobiaceae bacterium]|nr:Ig-like domain repeat protein [Casimicrobiaceae bacterium]
MLPSFARSRFVAAAFLAALMTGAAVAHDAHWARSAEALPDSAAETHAGVVEALVIDDRITGRVLRFPRIREASGQVVGLTGSATDALQAGDKVVLTGIRNGSALEVASVEKQSGAALAATKGSRQAEGMFTIAHSDDFVSGVSAYRHDVMADDGRVVALDLAASPAVLEGGMRVQVTGHDGPDGRLVPDTIVILEPPPGGTIGSKLTTKGTTSHSMLVIMANFSNTTAPAFTQAQAQAVMSTNANSVAAFYNDVSFGQHTLNVTVVPTWVQMAFAQSGCIDATLGGFTAAANSAATAAGYNPTNYSFVVYLFPSGGGCGWSGLGYIGYPHLAYINGISSFATSVIAHEVGHNFGLLHAGSLRCTGAIIGGTCTVAEYGDTFSAMGNSHAGHFNVLQKSLLGWITTPTLVTHTAGTATYTLHPLETAGGSVYGVKVPTPNAHRTYYIEYRQPLGFDGMWSGWISNGAQVRVGSPFEVVSGGDDTELLDMVPGTSTFTDAALTVGKTFTDPAYPVSISVVSATASALTVQVTSPAGSGPTTTSLTSAVNPAMTGSPVTFSSTVTGSLPTGSVQFSDGGVAIAGCASVALTGSGGSRTATCAGVMLPVGTHAIVAKYNGDINNATSSSPALSQDVLTPGWLGFQLGSSVATGAGSGVAAGSFNVASGQGSFVGAGTSNQAAGTSSLVIGGFDNHAIGIDSLVG